jgi:hypothetical protein
MTPIVLPGVGLALVTAYLAIASYRDYRDSRERLEAQR